MFKIGDRVKYRVGHGPIECPTSGPSFGIGRVRELCPAAYGYDAYIRVVFPGGLEISDYNDRFILVSRDTRAWAGESI